MAQQREVTTLMVLGPVDDELVPVLRCLCGYEPAEWTMVLGIYHDQPTLCPQCRRRFYVRIGVQIYEVLDGE